MYGATKLAGEQAVAASGADHLTLRTAWLYSNRGKNFLNTMLRLAGERSELRVVNDQIGCPTYSDRVAEATIAMLDGLYANGSVREERCGLYHVTCSGETSWWGFAQRIIELAGLAARVTVKPIPTSEYPTPARRPAYSDPEVLHFARVNERLAASPRSAVPLTEQETEAKLEAGDHDRRDLRSSESGQERCAALSVRYTPIRRRHRQQS